MKAKLLVTVVVNYIRRLFTLPYLSILLAIGLAVSSLNGYLGSVFDIARWKGLTESQGLSSFLFFNVSGAVSRLMPGILKQFKRVNSFVYPIFAAFCGVLGQIAVYFTPNYGGIVSSAIILAVTLVSQDQVPVASRLVFTIIGLLSMVPGPLYGRIRDRTGSYDGVLLIIGAAQIIGISLFVLASILRRRRNKKSETAQEVTKSTTTRL